MAEGPSPPVENCPNPYDADDTPVLHRAYREGWTARRDGAPHPTDPYAGRPRAHRAWLNGWQAAHQRLAPDRTSA
jgi:ribosome modulation factor